MGKIHVNAEMDLFTNNDITSPEVHIQIAPYVLFYSSRKYVLASVSNHHTCEAYIIYHVMNERWLPAFNIFINS